MISRLKIGERRKKALEADCFGVLVEGVVSRQIIEIQEWQRNEGKRRPLFMAEYLKGNIAFAIPNKASNEPLSPRLVRPDAVPLDLLAFPANMAHFLPGLGLGS